MEETVWEKAADTSDAEADGTPESQDVSASDRTEESMAAADGQDNRTRETGEGSYHSNFWPLIAIFAVIFLISIALGIRLRKHFRKK